MKELLQEKLSKRQIIVEELVTGKRRDFNGLSYAWQLGYIEAIADMAEHIGEVGIAYAADLLTNRAEFKRIQRRLKHENHLPETQCHHSSSTDPLPAGLSSRKR